MIEDKDYTRMAYRDGLPKPLDLRNPSDQTDLLELVTSLLAFYSQSSKFDNFLPFSGDNALFNTIIDRYNVSSTHVKERLRYLLQQANFRKSN